MTPQEKARDARLLKLYGIDIQQYNELLRRQSGVCACCGRPETESKQRLSVDHDHTTGEIRGLLCFVCNHKIIGRHRSYQIFESAARYLKGPYTGWIVPKEFLKGQKRKRKKRT